MGVEDCVDGGVLEGVEVPVDPSTVNLSESREKRVEKGDEWDVRTSKYAA
jgi:hypothetical protein